MCVFWVNSTGFIYMRKAKRWSYRSLSILCCHWPCCLISVCKETPSGFCQTLANFCPQIWVVFLFLIQSEEEIPSEVDLCDDK